MSERGESIERLTITEAATAVEDEPEASDPFAGISEEGRITAARNNGLPDSASWRQISQVAFERNRRRAAESLGLPVDTSMEEIKRVGPGIVLEQRKKELNLPADATWADVPAAKEAKRRASRNTEPDSLEQAA